MTENKAEIVEKSAAMEGAKNVFNSLGLVGLGLFLLLIPVIGWIVGGVLIFIGITALAASPIAAVSVHTYRGTCPYCGGTTEIFIHNSKLKETTGHSCKICFKRFVFRENRFHSIQS